MDTETPPKKRRLSDYECESQEEEERARIEDNTANNSEARSEERRNMRSITLDMSKYSQTIQELSDTELVEIFDIGVAIKKSFTLTISENNDFIKKELETQMQQIFNQVEGIQSEVKQSVAKIPNDVKDNISKPMSKIIDETALLKRGVLDEVAKMKTNLVGQVFNVCQKVQPMGELKDYMTTQFASNQKEILQKLDNYKEEVNKLAHQMQKPAIKGSVGENIVISILKGNIPSYTFTDVSTQQGKGDIHVQTPNERHLLIEVKEQAKNVPKSEIDKFKRDVACSHEVKVGLLFSSNSGIAMKCKDSRKFEVDVDNEKFLIYVPNALQQKEVMVWSVLLADDLAGMNVPLKDVQVEKLQQLCAKFQGHVQDAKKCREKMKALKNTMEDLESSMKPILQVIENAKKEINEIMKVKTIASQ